jgi:methyltransferase
MDFGWGAALLAYLTVQRVAELWWAKQNEQRLFAAGAVQYGKAHLPLVVLLHAAWMLGMWILAYDHPVNPFYLVLIAVLQIARFWVLVSLGRRWTIRILVVPGERLVARGPYRFLRHPNYAIVCGEIALVPLALGLPLTMPSFSRFSTLWCSLFAFQRKMPLLPLTRLIGLTEGYERCWLEMAALL